MLEDFDYAAGEAARQDWENVQAGEVLVDEARQIWVEADDRSIGDVAFEALRQEHGLLPITVEVLS